jgi:hypothetical protein
MRTVSEGAVIARVNRVLAGEGAALHKARGRHEVGEPLLHCRAD